MILSQMLTMIALIVGVQFQLCGGTSDCGKIEVEFDDGGACKGASQEVQSDLLVYEALVSAFQETMGIDFSEVVNQGQFVSNSLKKRGEQKLRRLPSLGCAPSLSSCNFYRCACICFGVNCRRRQLEEAAGASGVDLTDAICSKVREFVDNATEPACMRGAATIACSWEQGSME